MERNKPSRRGLFGGLAASEHTVYHDLTSPITPGTST
jgi:hypothetical protein